MDFQTPLLNHLTMFSPFIKKKFIFIFILFILIFKGLFHVWFFTRNATQWVKKKSNNFMIYKNTNRNESASIYLQKKNIHISFLSPLCENAKSIFKCKKWKWLQYKSCTLKNVVKIYFYFYFFLKTSHKKLNIHY